MDLDPGDDVTWQDVINAAGEVRERLRSAGLESFVKTSRSAYGRDADVKA